MSKSKRMWIERKRTRVVNSSMPVDSATLNAYVSGPISSKASKIPSRKTPPFYWGHHELRCPNPTHPGRTREVACRVNFVRSPLLALSLAVYKTISHLAGANVRGMSGCSATTP